MRRPDSDLESAAQYNGGIDLSKVQDMLAAVFGENDEASWYWLIKMGRGKYALAVGSCDYTGWDCQSSLTVYTFSTVAAALAFAPEDEPYRHRKIRAALKAQLDGKEQYGVISGANNE